LAEAFNNFLGRGGRPGQLYKVDFDSVACRFLLPAAAPAWMLLVGKHDFSARFQVETVADNVVPLGGIANQGQLIAPAIQDCSQRVAQLAQESIFLVAEPGIPRLRSEERRVGKESRSQRSVWQ